MAASTAGAFAGLDVRIPSGLRAAMIGVLGILIGGVFSPDLLESLGRWAAVAVLVAAYIVVVSLAVMVYFRLVGGFDPVTAYFAAMPGGLNEMVVTAEALGGDVRPVALIQAVRVLIVVFAIPFLVQWGTGVDTIGIARPHGAAALGPVDVALLGGGGVLGYALARSLRVPAAALVGPLIVSAGLHIGGITVAQPPAPLIAAAQVVIGCAVGTRFTGYPLREMRRVLLLAAGSSTLMVVLAALTAFGAAAAGLHAPLPLFLALAPGGLAEMSLVALAVGFDTALVATMQILRIAVVVVLAPSAFRLARRLRSRGPGEA